MSWSAAGVRARLALVLVGIAAATSLIMPAGVAQASGSWTWRNPLPQGCSFYKVDFTSTSQGWATGRLGVIMHTSDGGVTWTSQESGGTHELTGLDFLDSSTGWVVGLGRIMRTTDGGAHWTNQSSPVSRFLEDVCFVDSTHGWIVGSSGTILATTDGGAHWIAQNAGTTAWLLGVHFADRTHGWAVGSTGTILATTDGGAHWVSQASGTTQLLRDVASVDASHTWAVGNSGTIVVTGDAGANWTLQASGSTTTAVSVAFTDSAHGWVVTNSDVLSTYDGGATWTPRSLGAGAWATSAAFPDASHGCVVGSGGQIFTSSDGGTTWSSQVHGSTGKGHASVAFGSAMRGWAVGDGGLGVGGEIASTTDGGASWTIRDTAYSDLRGVDAPDATHACAVGRDGAIIVTTDGETWQDRSLGTSIDFAAVSLPSTSCGWAVGGSGMVASTLDGGSHWTTATLGTEYDFRDVEFVDSSHGWIVGQILHSGVATSVILATTDGGSHWATQVASPQYNTLMDIEFLDASRGWAVGSMGNVLATTDGGAHWVRQNVPGSGLWSAVCFANSVRGYIVGELGEVAMTGDGGAHWSMQQLRVEDLRCIATPTMDTAIAVGFSGIIGYAWDPDTTPPQTTLSLTPMCNAAGWNQTAVSARFAAVDDIDGSGVADTRYQIDSGPVRSYASTVALSAEGLHTLAYSSIDASGNAEATKTATVRIDGTAPALSLDTTASYDDSATIHVAASDAVSGLARVELKLDSGSWTTASRLTVRAAGPHTIYARAYDLAGNVRSTSAGFAIFMSAPPRLTLSAAKTVLPYSWWSVLLTARSNPGGNIRLQSSPDGVHWTDTGVSWASGAGSTTQHLDRKMYYRLLSPDDEWRPGAVSNVVKVTVVPYVPSPSAPSSVRRNRTFTVTTDLAAASPNASDLLTFRFYRYEKSHGRWSWVLRKSVRGVGRAAAENAVTYRARTSLPRAGKWKVAACYWGNDMYGATASGSRSLRVK